MKYEQTRIKIKENDSKEYFINIKNIYHYNIKNATKEIIDDKEIIDLSNLNIFVRDYDCSFTKILKCIRKEYFKKPYYLLSMRNKNYNLFVKNGVCGFNGMLVVTPDEEIIISDNSYKSIKDIQLFDKLYATDTFLKGEELEVTGIQYDWIMKNDSKHYVYDLVTESGSYEIGFMKVK